MKVLGLIVEYNPFHYGHIHHIVQAKKLVNPDVTIAIMSGNFVQRGEPAIIDKWTRSEIALKYGIDIVIELPFVYASQSADYFARGSIRLLKEIGVTDIIFGSESGDINEFKEIATCLKNNTEAYDNYVSKSMKEGLRYPDACNQALSKLMNKTITTPNDLLGLSYVKEVIINDYPINIDCIKRTNNYHDNTLHKISSASALRHALSQRTDVSDYLPCVNKYENKLNYLEDFYFLLKFKLLTSSKEELSTLHLVDEGIENLLIKNILEYNTMTDYIDSLTSKRYTKTRIQRMIIHILMNNQKDEINNALNDYYLHILKMNSNGQNYLNKVKKNLEIPLITTFSSYNSPSLQLDEKATKLYSCLYEDSKELFIKEYKNIPVIK